MTIDPRIQELVDLAAEEGITLPYSPAVIVGLEDKGKYVDLSTGLIHDVDERISLTVLGEANVAVQRTDEE
ncbi:MAG: hypothetical protein R2932_59105 [Caldilineaceae bacterium]